MFRFDFGCVVVMSSECLNVFDYFQWSNRKSLINKEDERPFLGIFLAFQIQILIVYFSMQNGLRLRKINVQYIYSTYSMINMVHAYTTIAMVRAHTKENCSLPERSTCTYVSLSDWNVLNIDPVPTPPISANLEYLCLNSLFIFI